MIPKKRVISYVAPYSLRATVGVLRKGKRDRTVVIEQGRLWLTGENEQGLFTLQLNQGADSVCALAFGPGAEVALQQVHHTLGLPSEPWQFEHELVSTWLRRSPGIRLMNHQDVYRGLVRVILGQQVTKLQATASFNTLVQQLGSPAPGPSGLMVVPSPSQLLSVSIEQLQSFGILRKQATRLAEVARRHKALRRVNHLPTVQAKRLLERVPGLGPWSSTMLLSQHLGRPEPIILGDYHLANTVVYAFTGEARGTDAQMVSLLAPFRGRAAQVIRLIKAAHISAPKYGPKRQAFLGFS